MDRTLLHYLPPVVQKIEEIQIIMDAEQDETEKLYDAAADVLRDQFVTESTANGVKRWERILGAVPKAGDTMESRKQYILSKLNCKLPYTIRELRRNLNDLCGEDGYRIHFQEGSYFLLLALDMGRDIPVSTVKELLANFLPANIYYLIDQQYPPFTINNTNCFNLESMELQSTFHNFGRRIILDGSRLLDGS